MKKMKKTKRKQRQKFGNQTYKSEIDEDEIEDHFSVVEARQCNECGQVVDWDVDLEMTMHLDEQHGITIKEYDDDDD